nr:tetratricopeptide repeat protein [Bacteroidota bacterium]
MKNLIHSVVLSFLVLIVAGSCQQKSDQDGGKNENSVPKAVQLNQKISEDPDNDALYIERAKYFLSRNKADSAMRDILIAIDIDDRNTNHFLTLSDAYLAMGNPEKCKDALDKALTLDENNEEALLKLAELQLIMQNYQSVFDAVERLLKIDRINPLAYFIRGYTLLEKGDTANAVRDFKIAADQDQDNYDAIFQLGVIYAAWHNPLAIAYFNNSINIRPNDTQPYYHLALYYQENDEIEKAISNYLNILQMNPNHIFTIYNLGYIHLVFLHEFDKAVEYFNQVIELNPDYAEAYYNRGYSYELLGEKEFSRKDYLKTLKLKTNYPKAIEGLNRLD